jgi:hypothetical protein
MLKWMIDDYGAFDDLSRAMERNTRQEAIDGLE